MAAVCYGICRGDSLPQQQQEYIPSSLYKKVSLSKTNQSIRIVLKRGLHDDDSFSNDLCLASVPDTEAVA